MPSFVLYIPDFVIGQDVAQSLSAQWPNAVFAVCGTAKELHTALDDAAPHQIFILMVTADALSRAGIASHARITTANVVMLESAPMTGSDTPQSWVYLDLPFSGTSLIEVISTAFLTTMAEHAP